MKRGRIFEGEAWVMGSPGMNELLQKAVHVCVGRRGLGRTLRSGTGAERLLFIANRFSGSTCQRRPAMGVDPLRASPIQSHTLTGGRGLSGSAFLPRGLDGSVPWGGGVLCH